MAPACPWFCNCNRPKTVSGAVRVSSEPPLRYGGRNYFENLATQLNFIFFTECITSVETVPVRAPFGFTTNGGLPVNSSGVVSGPATDMVSFRLEPSVRRAIESLTGDANFEVNSYIQRLLRLHAIEGANRVADQGGDIITEQESNLIAWSHWLIDAAVRKAKQLDKAGAFTAHFTLSVIHALFEDPEFAANYAKIQHVGLRECGVSAKSALNMALGFHIKIAARAEPLLDEGGKTRRVQIRSEQIQSYTLLTRPKRTTDWLPLLQAETNLRP